MSLRAASSGRRWRTALTLAVLAPPIALLLSAAPAALRHGVARELSCWVLPNLRVLATPGNEACPIGASQGIARAEQGEVVAVRDHAHLRSLVAQEDSRRLRLEVQEGARRQWLEVPLRSSERPARMARIAVTAAGVSFLLAIPLLLLWRSPSPAATPLSVFYACVCVVLVATRVGQHSVAMTRTALLALVLAPAGAMHLSLVFPARRRIVEEARALAGVPYVVSALLLPIGWVSLERDPLLWPAFVSLLVALTAAAWIVLVVACALSLRESRSVLERARARLVLYGAALVPLVPTLWLSRGHPEVGQVATSYLWSAAVTLPLPIALAIGRHNLFDLEWDARHAIARAVYLAIATGAVAALLDAVLMAAHVDSPLREPAPLLVLAAACVGAVDLLRSRTLGPLSALMGPQQGRWRRIREQLERSLSIQRDPDEIARWFCEALCQGLALQRHGLLLEERGAWRAAQASTEPVSAREAAEIALRVLGRESICHLAASNALQDEAAPLCAAGFEAVVALESGATRYGLLLLGSPQRRRPLNQMELDFAAGLAAQAAIALRNARMTAEWVAWERHAAAGRVALGLAHDVGKDLGWMRSLVKRLPERIGDPQRLARDAARIEELTDALAGAIERFVREATDGTRAGGALRRLDELMEEAVRRVERLHGEARVVRNVDPVLRALRVGEGLGRVVGNLLDNALHASATDAQVTLVATHERGCLQVVVEDAGCGMSEQQLARAFEPGFTTRADAGGSGVGLPVALEIVETLGGRLELCSGARGTRATLRLPVAR